MFFVAYKIKGLGAGTPRPFSLKEFGANKFNNHSNEYFYRNILKKVQYKIKKITDFFNG